MKTNYSKSLILLIVFAVLISCGNEKPETKEKTNHVKEASKTSSKKKKKEDKTIKATSVIVEATVNGKKLVYEKNDPKHNNVVVLFNDYIQLKYTDVNGMIVLVHLYDSEIYNKTPINFEKQVATLSRSEQANVKVKSSKLSFTTLGTKPGSLIIEELYNGVVTLKEFSEERIIILFEGQGFPVGVNNGKSKLFPMKGKISINNYNTHDARR